MARIVLLRHAHSVANEKNLLAGRTAGISLSKTGREQAEDLIARLGATQFDEVATGAGSLWLHFDEKRNGR